MSLYLIDFENVHDSGVNGILQLSAEDEVSIFYSQKSEHMSFDTHVSIMKTKAKVNYIKLRKCAKNYLDFQLATHLGYLIGTEAKGPFFVISKDTGYDSVVDYWRERGTVITRMPSIAYGFDPRFKRNNQLQVSMKQGGPALPLHKNELIPSESRTGSFENTVSEEMPESFREDTASWDEDVFIQTDVSQDEASCSVPSGEDCSTENTADAPEEVPADETDTSKDAPETGSFENKVSDKAADETVKMPPADPEPAEKEPEPPTALPEAFRKKVRTALKGKNIPSGNYSAIYKAIVNSYDRLALNNHMVKSFGSSKGGVVYNAIKDIFTEYQSL